jgi:hypothetical protein
MTDIDIDLDQVRSFLATHARVLDRRRFEVLVADDASAASGSASASALLALDAYRNPDGGYGWGIEPDLRSTESQPAGALHAFEVLAEAGPLTSPRAVEICDWAAGAALTDGGLPFALEVSDPAGCAPFWAGADTAAPSLHITTAVCSIAWRVARHNPAVAAHPWLAATTEWCLDGIRGLSSPHAIELMYVLHLLDELATDRADARELLERTAADHLPPDATVAVAGGLADERLRPLDFSPWPDRPLRALVQDDAVEADLQRLRSLQQDDGGWIVDFASSSPAAAHEWRGYATVGAVAVLRANGS